MTYNGCMAHDWFSFSADPESEPGDKAAAASRACSVRRIDSANQPPIPSTNEEGRPISTSVLALSAVPTGSCASASLQAGHAAARRGSSNAAPAATDIQAGE